MYFGILVFNLSGAIYGLRQRSNFIFFHLNNLFPTLTYQKALLDLMKNFQGFMGTVALQNPLNIKQWHFHILRQIIYQIWKMILKKEKGRIRKVECNKDPSYELYFLWNTLNELYSYYYLLQEGVFIWLKHLGASPWGPMSLNAYLNF